MVLKAVVFGLSVSVLSVAVSSVVYAEQDNGAVWEAIRALEEQVDATASVLEANNEAAAHGESGQTTIGGYGEWHLNKLDSRSELDAHRIVLFVGHEFDDRLRFFSEWDLEHADSLELEQAFLSLDLGERQRLSAGVLLMPIGIVNESHEPTVFYGVERNPVETTIIPSTWREGGVALSGSHHSGFSYDLFLTSGLNARDDPATVDDEAYVIRSGRQQVSKAVAGDAAVSGRLKWTGRAGIELAVAVQRQMNVTQGQDADAAATLFESHLVVNRGALTVKALYARWDIDGVTAAAAGRDVQSGAYIEPSWKFSRQLGIAARYSVWDSRAGDAFASREKQWLIGGNYWLRDGVVLKVDFLRQSLAGQRSDEGFNMAVGYAF